MEIQDLKERLRKSLQVIQKLQGQLEAAKQTQQTAVIGVSCRLPGGIDTMDELWDFLYKGGNAITGYPQERLDALGYKEEDISNVKGGFIKDIEYFDPTFFNIGLQEAAAMDPQHRLLLEMVWRAFEDAGLDIHAYKGKRVGVYIALSNNDYSLQRLRSSNTNPYDFTGNILAPAAGRISYAFDFRGPCSVVDTACSSALVAFHQAHTALNNRECDLAIVGGINLILDLGLNKALQSIDALAADGYCKPLDASADGYTRSEGGGVLLLKRANDIDGHTDKPYCIVRGSYLNHDGHSNGFTAPSGQAQEAVLSGALQAAGLSSNDIDYIELHGTGTALGDPIEVDAIQNTFINEERNKPLYIGSVKSNMGHLECAAGLAGLFKSILVLKHRTIPPTIHIRKLNPLIEWQERIEIPLMPQRLSHKGKTRIGISSFGISGTNVHVIIESANEIETSQPDSNTIAHTLLLSAASPKALRQLTENYIDFLQRTRHDWKDICAAAATHTHWAYRIAIIAPSVSEAIEKLQALSVFDNEVSRKNVKAYTGAADLVNKCIELLDGDKKKEAEQLLSRNGHGISALVALLYTAGIDCDWPVLIGRVTGRIQVPGYPFHKISCWVNKEHAIHRADNIGIACQHPVFTQCFSIPGNEDSISFTGVVSLKQMPWLSGHQLFDTVIFPGAGFLDWMMFAAKEIGDGKKSVSQLMLKEPLVLQEGAQHTIWLQADKNGEGYTCKAYSKIEGNKNAEWTLHATAEIIGEISIDPIVGIHEKTQPLNIPSFYKQCRLAGIGYSGAFAMLNDASVVNAQLQGIVKWKAPAADKFALHPALLDNCFQLLGAYVMTGDATNAYVPYKMDAVNKYADIVGGDVEVLIQLPGKITSGFHSLKVDITILQDKEVKACIRGFNLVKISREQLAPLLGNELNKHVYIEEWVDADSQHEKSNHSKYTIPVFENAVVDESLSARAANGIRQLDALAINWVAHILHELNITETYNVPHSAIALRNGLKIQENHARLFDRLLSVAVEQGWASKKDDTVTFREVPVVTIRENISQLEQNEHLQAELNVLNRCAANIAGILKGDTNPVEILFPGGSIEYVKALYASDAFTIMHRLTAECFTDFIKENAGKGNIRILEIGGGTGSTTRHILPLLMGMDVSYDFTDISPLFLHEAQITMKQYGFVNYKVLDIEKDLAAQEYDLDNYDLIIASNVLHATRSLAHTFQQVRQLLKSSGTLFMVEGTSKMLWIDLVFGITSGWWLFDDVELRPSHALLSTKQWDEFLNSSGFNNIQILSPQHGTETSSGQSVIWASKEDERQVNLPLLLLPSNEATPVYLNDIECAYLSDVASIPANRPIVIVLDENGDTDIEFLIANSLWVYTALAVLRKEDKQRTIFLVANGKNAKTYTGLWRSLQNECRNWDVRLVIVNEPGDINSIIKAEINRGAKDECSYWDKDKRTVLRLSQAVVTTQNKPTDWTGKNILITGGGGGVGRQLTDWLLEKGAGNIYITGRNSNVNSNDARVIYLQSDISKEMPQGITGDIYAVFHLAGIVDDNPFWKQTEQSLTAVLAAKVNGTNNVLKFAKAHNTKHVVLFSSSAAVLGTIGQTNHALASAYLQNKVSDGAIGVTSIAWGPWKGAGAVEKYNVDDIAARIGVTPADANANFRLMEQLMEGDTRAVAAVHIDWNKYATGMKTTPYWSQFLTGEVNTVSMPVEDFEEAAKEGMEAVIHYLRNVVSVVLGHKEMQLFDADAGFFDIGLDSLTALDLKNKLQAVLREELPSTLVFKYPSIRSMAAYMLECYKVASAENLVVVEEQWDEAVDALKFIEEEFNNLFDDGTAIK